MMHIPQPLQTCKIGFLVLTFCIGLNGCGTPGKARQSDPRESVKIEGRNEMQTETNPPGTRINSSNNDQATLLFERAVQSLELGQPDKAMDDLRQVVSLAPHLSVPHNNLGILYKRKGLLEKAIEEYQEALRLKPDYAEAHNNLGMAYREKGLFKEAERAYREAIRLKSDLGEAHFNLGVLYDLYLNRPGEAIQHYKDYLRLGGQKRQEVELWISVLQQKLQSSHPSP
jgi:Flp pilus assembly protein TadD